MENYRLNNLIIVNVTPHEINFDYEGDVIKVPSTAIVNARVVEEEVAPGLVRTKFEETPEGREIVNKIISKFKDDFEAGTLRIVGSMIASNAYPEVVGVTPVPGFERVPPAEKRMSSSKFNVGEKWISD